MKGKKRTIDDWRNAAIGAAKELSGQARTSKEIKKSLRDSLSSAWHRRPSSIEVNKLLEMMTAAGVIKEMAKTPVKIGAWSGATDIVAYEIIPEKVSEMSEKAKVAQPEPKIAKRELRFKMSIQKGGLTEGSLWHNGVILKSFEEFSIIQFILDQSTQDDSKKFGEAIEELRSQKIGYSFDLSTNPGVVRVVEGLMAL